MDEKRILIVPKELAKKIDDNRGDISQAEFIEFLIDHQLNNNQLMHFLTGNQLEVKEETKEQKYATKEEIRSFEQDMKKLLKSFLDFFVSYGLEIGKQSPKTEFGEFTSKLQELENDLDSEGKDKEAKIKWK